MLLKNKFTAFPSFVMPIFMRITSWCVFFSVVSKIMSKDLYVSLTFVYIRLCLSDRVLSDYF